MFKETVSNMLKNAYLHPLRYGIAQRREFWWCFLVSVLLSSVSYIVLAYIYVNYSTLSLFHPYITFAISGFFIVVLIWTTIMWFATKIRRIHDLGYSGWWVVVVSVLLYATSLGSEYSNYISLTFLAGVLAIITLIISVTFFLLLGLCKSKTEHNARVEKAKAKAMAYIRRSSV